VSTSEPQAIEAEIAATRARLASTVDELSGRLRPQEIGRRSLAGAAGRARRVALTPGGAPRIELVAAVAGAALVVAWMVRRRLR
jgi:hypothetical protein